LVKGPNLTQMGWLTRDCINIDSAQPDSYFEELEIL